MSKPHEMTREERRCLDERITARCPEHAVPLRAARIKGEVMRRGRTGTGVPMRALDLLFEVAAIDRQLKLRGGG